MIENYFKYGFDSDTIILFFSFLVFFLFGLLALLKYYSTKARWHFTSTELIKRPDLGRVKRIAKQTVRSIFIKEIITRTNGVYSGSNYWVVLSLSNGQSEHLIHLDDENENSTFLGEIIKSGQNNKASDALKIATVISEYWNIPVSV